MKSQVDNLNNFLSNDSTPWHCNEFVEMFNKSLDLTKYYREKNRLKDIEVICEEYS